MTDQPSKVVPVNFYSLACECQDWASSAWLANQPTTEPDDEMKADLQKFVDRLYGLFLNLSGEGAAAPHEEAQTPAPQGGGEALDYDRIYDDVTERFPKVLAALKPQTPGLKPGDEIEFRAHPTKHGLEVAHVTRATPPGDVLGGEGEVITCGSGFRALAYVLEHGTSYASVEALLSAENPKGDTIRERLATLLAARPSQSDEGEPG